MPPLRKRICLLVVLGLFVAPVMSGCASSSEPTLASAVAKSGVVDGVVESLKAGDDAAEAQRLRENAPESQSEREEARDQHEQTAMEASEASEDHGPAETGE